MKIIPLVLILSGLLLSASCTGVHERTLQSVHGKHISEAIAVLGEPYSISKACYLWNKSKTVQHGGYYTTRYETSRHYDKNGKLIGSTQVPFREYVQPYTVRNWCITAICVDSEEIITSTDFDGNACDKPAGFWK